MNTACHYSNSAWMKGECQPGSIVWCIASLNENSYPMCLGHAQWFKEFYSGCIEVLDEDEALVHNLMLR